jgi:ribokinase
MEVPFAQSLETARKTKAARGTVIWNLAPVPEKMTGKMVRDVLETADYLVVNEHEALDAAAALGANATDFEIAAQELAKLGRLFCVVTAGAEGAFAFAPDGGRVHVPTLKIEPVDTTGAGDTFVGAFACLVSEKAPLSKALEAACEAAALKCLKRGAQDGMPARSALKAVNQGAH